MNTDNRTILFSSLTILLWGLWGFFGKLALERKMAPTTLFLIETLMTTVLSVPIFLTLVYCYKAQPLALGFNLYGLLSGTALALGILFYYFALAEGRLSIIMPLTAIYPVVAALLGVAFLRERPSLAQWLGIILIVAGVALVLSSPIKATAG
jgi:bacterial/archaeal transporter family protein